MARCKNCGKVNREGALFCQDCGKAIEGPHIALPVAAQIAAPSAPLLAVDSSKRAAEVRGAAPSSTSGPGGRITCSQCGQPTPSGFTFCQHCGNRMGVEAPPRRDARAGRLDIPSTDVPPPSTTGSAGTPGSAGVIGLAGASAASAPSAVARPLAADPPKAAVRSSGTLHGRLVILRRDGSDGEEVPFAGETFDIGRAVTSGKSFSDDPFMAARHARFFVHAGGVRVRPLDTVNGVFIQLREPHELQAGDVFYIGRELLRFEPLGPEERDPPTAVELGVRVFGSTPRESFGRLRQLTNAALVRDVWHLSRAEILLGREEGDIVFPDDEFMSRRHALVSRVGGRVRLEDQHSSNGTYVRLRGDRDVQPNDVLRIGDQVLRYEP